MKKYAYIGVGLLLVFTAFQWQGNQSFEQQINTNEVHSSDDIRFSSEQEATEKLQRLQLMLKAIQLPTDFPFEVRDTTFSAASLTEDTLATLHYTGDEKQEIVLTITTKNPILHPADVEKIAFEEQTGWLYETDKEINVIVEKEGLYYHATSSMSSSQELFQLLHSLEETTIEPQMDIENVTFPALFPGEVLAIEEVRYTKGQEEAFTITYVMKEEYTVAYTIRARELEEKPLNWKKVKMDDERKAFYSQQENHLMWEEDKYTYEMTSYGRELSLDEFLLMTK